MREQRKLAGCTILEASERSLVPVERILELESPLSCEPIRRTEILRLAFAYNMDASGFMTAILGGETCIA